MSMWCPKCQNITYNKKKCDKCDHVIEDKSKSYDIPKPKKVRILKPKPIQKKETSSFIDVLDEVVDELFSENKKLTKKNFKESTKKTYQDKKIRGDEYEEFIAEHYRKLGCHVIEHGKEQGVKDGGIDLIAKLGNEVILIQCKDWNENNSHKIDHKDIKVLRTDANDFLEKNPIYKNCEIKLRYTLSGNFLHKSAEKHMEECKEDISCEIIKPTYRIEELSGSNYTKKLSRKKKTIQATYREKIIIGIISILVILFILKPKYETEEVNYSNAMKNMIVVTKPNHELEKKIVEKNKIEKRRKVVEKKVIAANSRYSENRKVLKVQDEKSKREEAKAILMMQMQN